MSSLIFTPVGDRQLPVRGASAVAAVAGALFVVEDDAGIYRVRGNRAVLWAGRDLHPALGDLEGLAVNDTETMLWAVSENSGAVLAIPLRAKTPRPTVIGYLPRPGMKKNKGFEGLAFVSARLSPSRRASLVAVNEGSPRRVGFFALPDLELTHEFKLPRNAKEALKDLADVTVDPLSGELLLLSDQSRRIAIMRIVDGTLVMTGSYDLPLKRKEKPEGIDFGSASHLLVVTDDSGKLLEISTRRHSRRSGRSRDDDR